MPSESRHIAVHVERPVDEVYAYASDPSHLPGWAPGLCTAITPVDDHWVAESGMGHIVVRYARPTRTASSITTSRWNLERPSTTPYGSCRTTTGQRSCSPSGARTG